ncbi:hypothetical protein FUT69_00680 [Xylella taiwanensis]|uniref:Uncharacterized protein n=1 Tax=Xylella taiwanensis TaxID=1444770 RepID=Z9JLT4_9GAMM|nr:hypothetical protein [Xylella taiwanensis]AXI83135.1 hypothetical protein AB672_03830 [Xylella taiwanensis]EWS78791.1 hypothetical protein AF72_04260 [Xylella taiwanensis]MCD8456181.1 hypothetical protein [Xylella taiwanensis]MCD8458589.1 hypothetical protein [Xylella taiwanensis]MCD8460723.1 hypothetical protein [Xylella taiwanensis]
MNEPNFEAIGRYQHARQHMATLSWQRNDVLKQLSRFCERCVNTTRSTTISKLNVAALHTHLEAVRDADAALMAAVAECNRWAVEAKALPIRIESHPT